VNGQEENMGLTFLDIEVGNPANPDVTGRARFLIDSGAIHSVVPTAILDRLGIRSFAQDEYNLADGSKVMRRRGAALFKLGEKVGAADVIFGEEGDSNLLGATTLESMSLALDPLRRELRPLPLVLWR
jgi:clan AA aspartic protease